MITYFNGIRMCELAKKKKKVVVKMQTKHKKQTLKCRICRMNLMENKNELIMHQT